MKIVKYLFIVLTGFFLFAACQKETSFERETLATGTLKDTAGNCPQIIINGKYSADSALTDSNFIVVPVNFSSTGSYNIFTDSSNGFSFQGSGSVKETGLHSIRLTGTGKPIVAEQTAFSVVFDSSICTFSVFVAAGSGGKSAVYTLAGYPDNCSNANVQGVYIQSTALSSTNYVDAEVNVDSVGDYSIVAGPTNGMTFVGQGTFTSIGTQTIRLQGSGTPDTPGSNNIPVSAGNSSCNFNVDVVEGTPITVGPNNADSAWQFSEGTNFYHGFFLDAFDTTLADIGYVAEFEGLTSETKDTAFNFQIQFPGGSIQPGTYSTTASNVEFYFADNTDPSLEDIYAADSDTPGSDIKIVISDYDPVTGIITGTFSGTAMSSSNMPLTITDGKFKAVVQ